MAFRKSKIRRRVRTARKSNFRQGLTLIEISIVLVILSILMFLTTSLINNVSLFKSTEDEAETLKKGILYSAETAVLSNEVVYLELDLDKESYRSFRMERNEGEVNEEIILKEHNLSDFHSLISVTVSGGGTVNEKKILIPFTPDGSSQETAIYMGSEPQVNTTLIIRKYGPRVDIVKGEGVINLENPEWEEKLEEF